VLRSKLLGARHLAVMVDAPATRRAHSAALGVEGRAGLRAVRVLRCRRDARYVLVASTSTVAIETDAALVTCCVDGAGVDTCP
jgi:hypothetical protein